MDKIPKQFIETSKKIDALLNDLEKGNVDRGWIKIQLLALIEETIKKVSNLDKQIHDDLRESQKKLMEKIDKMQWIEFDKQKPEHSGEYIISNGDEVFPSLYYRDEMNFYSSNHIKVIVREWMPLPSLPEGEK
jgi:SAM-dependent MidA family methyltransferase